MTSAYSSATDDERQGSTALGVVLTLIMVLAYFSFIGFGAFFPALLAQPLSAGGVTTVAFAYGLFVIVLGVALTTFYVWYANRRAA